VITPNHLVATIANLEFCSPAHFKQYVDSPKGSIKVLGGRRTRLESRFQSQKGS